MFYLLLLFSLVFVDATDRVATSSKELRFSSATTIWRFGTSDRENTIHPRKLSYDVRYRDDFVHLDKPFTAVAASKEYGSVRAQHILQDALDDVSDASIPFFSTVVSVPWSTSGLTRASPAQVDSHCSSRSSYSAVPNDLHSHRLSLSLHALKNDQLVGWCIPAMADDIDPRNIPRWDIRWDEPSTDCNSGSLQIGGPAKVAGEVPEWNDFFDLPLMTEQDMQIPRFESAFFDEYFAGGWTVKVSSLSAPDDMPGPDVLASWSAGLPASLSTSYPYIHVPYGVHRLLERMGLGRDFRVSCDLTKFPTFSFSFGAGKEVVLDPQNYITKVRISTDDSICVHPFTSNAGVVGEPDVVVLGIPFLKSLWTVFDAANDKISIATRQR